MRRIEDIFFELLRVSIGEQSSLSVSPTDKEWEALYAMAKKQTLGGICYEGVQRLQIFNQNPPGSLNLQWMVMVASIQHTNEVLNHQCFQLQELLLKRGFKSSILKGQGAAHLYGDKLSLLRQPGDIDIIIEGGRESARVCADSFGVKINNENHHVNLDIFENTDVELHFAASSLIVVSKNSKYQKWISKYAFQDCQTVSIPGGYSFIRTSNYFNVVFMLSHMHRHFFTVGLGLRQFMDYYFVLKNSGLNELQLDQLRTVVDKIGMTGFAEAVMWVLHEVFGLEPEFMPWPIDENRGRYMLREVMRGGNFGAFDDTYKRTKGASHLKRFLQTIVYGFRFCRYFPAESMWIPVDHLMRFVASRKIFNRK